MGPAFPTLARPSLLILPYPPFLSLPLSHTQGRHPDHLGVSDPQMLGTVERCFAELLPVPRLEERLCVLLLMRSFEPGMQHLQVWGSVDSVGLGRGVADVLLLMRNVRLGMQHLPVCESVDVVGVGEYGLCGGCAPAQAWVWARHAAPTPYSAAPRSPTLPACVLRNWCRLLHSLSSSMLLVIPRHNILDIHVSYLRCLTRLPLLP